MSLGFEAAGFDIAASIEFDAIHSLVHHVNLPYAATICKDISAVTREEIYQQLAGKGYSGNIDVVVGGPPCQGFSHIGKRVLDDPRNRLVFEYLRIVRETAPKYFVFENVPGIATGKHKALLTELVSAFDKIGYSVVQPYRVLNAANYGVPQTRKRLILLGYRSDLQPPSYPAPTHEEGERQRNNGLFESRAGFTGSSDAISDLARHEAFVGDDPGIDAGNDRYEGFRESFDFEPRGMFSLCHKRTLKRKIWGHVGSRHTTASIERFDDTEPGKTEKISRFFKLHPDKPCHTMRAGTASDRGAHTAPRPIHYSMPRCITVREAARLHGFPDWFQFHRTIWHGFREIGNAVPPIFAKSIADEIMKRLELNSSALPTRVLENQDASLLSCKMSQASEYWGVPDNVIPKRKRSPSGVFMPSHPRTASRWGALT